MSDDTERMDWLEAHPLTLHGRNRDVLMPSVEAAQSSPGTNIWIARRAPYVWAAPTLRDAIDFARGTLTPPAP